MERIPYGKYSKGFRQEAVKLVVDRDLPIQKISQTVHIYPTMGQIVKRGADQYYKEKLFTGWFPKLAKFLIRF